MKMACACTLIGTEYRAHRATTFYFCGSARSDLNTCACRYCPNDCTRVEYNRKSAEPSRHGRPALETPCALLPSSPRTLPDGVSPIFQKGLSHFHLPQLSGSYAFRSHARQQRESDFRLPSLRTSLREHDETRKERKGGARESEEATETAVMKRNTKQKSITPYAPTHIHKYPLPNTHIPPLTFST